MKKLLLLLILPSFLFISCKTKTFFHYSTGLTKVELENESKTIGAASKSYSDSIIYAIWYITRDGFEFNLNNKTDHPMVLDWNGVSYIDENGFSSRVIHNDIRYIDRNDFQQPSIIPPGASIRDIIIPTNNVFYSHYHNSEYNHGYHAGGWRTADLFPYYTKDIYERNIWLDKYLGKNISIYMPVSVDGELYNYKFTFTINEITIQQKRPKGVLTISDKKDIPKGAL